MSETRHPVAAALLSILAATVAVDVYSKRSARPARLLRLASSEATGIPSRICLRGYRFPSPQSLETFLAHAVDFCRCFAYAGAMAT